MLVEALETNYLIIIIKKYLYRTFLVSIFAKIKSNKIEIFIPNSIYINSSFAVTARVLYDCELENKSS